METRARKRKRLLAATTTTSASSSNYNNYYIPADITENIFLRLPPKSLIKFQLTSKHFCSLIQNPNFISTHLLQHHSNHPNHYILLLTPDDPTKHHPKLFSLLGDQATVSPIKTPSFLRPSTHHHHDANYAIEVIGSCNGLLCISLDKEATKIVLWNPSTKQFREIPKPKAPITQGSQKYFMLGFGYVPRTNDYKVVRIVRNYKNNKCIVQVFSLKSNSWTRNTSTTGCLFGEPPLIPPYQYHYHESLSWKSLDGVLYWFDLHHDVDNNNNNNNINAVRMLTFDLHEEVFSRRVVPWNNINGGRLGHKLVPLKGSSSELAMVEYFRDQDHHEEKARFHIWMMNGSDMSWKKFGRGTVSCCEKCDLVVGVWRGKDDDDEDCYMILRNGENDKLFLYKNSQDNNNIVKEIVLKVDDGIENYNLSAFSFAESLVPVYYQL